MSKKERDIWDDAIRSKLEDFEMDTLPGDWEAIADRLPGKAPVPFRRTLRYWAAAAVVSLLMITSGVYLFRSEKEPPPVADRIEQETKKKLKEIESKFSGSSSDNIESMIKTVLDRINKEQGIEWRLEKLQRGIF